MNLLIFTIVVVGFLFWLSQVIRVVSMNDDEFEGHNDKVIFFIIVFFGSIFGAMWFFLWMLTKDQERESDERLNANMKAFISGTANGTPGTPRTEDQT